MEKVRLKDLPLDGLPRERFKLVGPNNLSDEEILSIILRCGYKDVNVKSLSNIILKEIGSLSNLKDMTIEELSNIKGIGYSKAITLLASLELGKRVYNSKINSIKLDEPIKIYEKFKNLFLFSKQELFYVAYLDSKLNLISCEFLFKGSLDKSNVYPREIFKYAVKYNASSIILMHNHPMGLLDSSINDEEFTDNIYRLCKMMDIRLADHIIFTDNGYFSFYDAGLIRG